MKALETKLSVFSQSLEQNEIIERLFDIIKSSTNQKSYLEQALEIINERKVGNDYV